jgi:hypothetical protein
VCSKACVDGLIEVIEWELGSGIKTANAIVSILYRAINFNSRSLEYEMTY